MTDKIRQAAETQPTESDLEITLRPRGLCAPVGDRFEYEQQMNSLPVAERKLAEEVTRHADLCRYFSENDMQVPPHICREVVESRKLAVPQRAERMQEINEELMEYLYSVSQNTEFRM